MSSDTIAALAETLIRVCSKKHFVIAGAESCTGGMAMSALVSVPGASAVVDRGFITYSNEAKIAMLGVPAALIEQYGAVSGEVAASMAEGALARSNAGISFAVTGVAGPGGGTEAKPVGLVYVACSLKKDRIVSVTERQFFTGSRQDIREEAVKSTFRLMLHIIDPVQYAGPGSSRK